LEHLAIRVGQELSDFSILDSKARRTIRFQNCPVLEFSCVSRIYVMCLAPGLIGIGKVALACVSLRLAGPGRRLQAGLDDHCDLLLLLLVIRAGAMRGCAAAAASAKLRPAVACHGGRAATAGTATPFGFGDRHALRLLWSAPGMPQRGAEILLLNPPLKLLRGAAGIPLHPRADLARKTKTSQTYPVPSLLPPQKLSPSWTCSSRATKKRVRKYTR
jgi:hypothetical protein